MSADVANKIEQALEQAMQAERQGYYFYHMAAAHTPDERGKQVFADLADQERMHFDYLQRQLESFRKTGRPDSSLKFEVPRPEKTDHPIFSEQIKNRIKEAHYEMTALSVGIQLEANSRDFYLQQAEAAGEPELSDFFRKLADWESVHYHLLLEQQQALQQQYWNEARFAPF